MKKSFSYRMAFAAVGLGLAAITQVSDAALDRAGASEPTTTFGSEQVATATESRRVVHGPTFTLYVEDENGNPFRLIRVEGVGWKYADGWKGSGNSGTTMFRKIFFASTAPVTIPKANIPDTEPLTVFIDGPSGFAFVYNPDTGWKFVGKIADRNP